jgi:hypothetical protein
MRALPFPPPASGRSAWPDREALLADRGRALDELVRLSTGPAGPLALVLSVAGFQLAWLLLATALNSVLADREAFTLLLACATVLLALLPLVPSAVAVVLRVRRELRLRVLLREWAALAHDPVRDARLRRPPAAVCWLLLSFGLLTAGAVLAGMQAGAAGQGAPYGGIAGGYGDAASGRALRLAGAAAICLVAGTAGLVKVFDHLRLTESLTAQVPPRPRGGAHR